MKKLPRAVLEIVQRAEAGLEEIEDRGHGLLENRGRPGQVVPLEDVVVDDKPVAAAEAARLFRFHKPSGLITAERDPAGRPTIYTALKNALPPGTPRLMPVGRLDFNTEGLLLMTNDGELKRAMELPASGIPRTYRARTYGNITQAQLEELIDGITIEGIHYGKIDANMERKTGRNQWIELTLTEGKNREVRRVLEALGLEVSRLLRTSYGPFELADLPRGQAVEIKPSEVEKFCKTLKTLPKQAPGPVGAAKPARSGPPRSGPARRKPDPSRPVDRDAPRSPPRRSDGRSDTPAGGRSGRQSDGRSDGRYNNNSRPGGSKGPRR